MELRTTTQRKHAYARLANRCAQCDEALFMPAWTEYLNATRARHLWECDACGYRFETLVRFPESSTADAVHVTPEIRA